MRPMLESIPALLALEPLVANALRSTALIAIAALAALALRRAPAATRHLVWTLALFGCIAMPLASRVAPEWSLSVLPSWPRSTVPAVASQTVDVADTRVSPAPAESGPASEPASVASVPDPAPSPPPARTWRFDREQALRLVPILWLMGVMLMLVRYLLASLRLARAARRSKPVADPAWTQALARHAAALGLQRLPALRSSNEIQVPLVCGALHPTILLPLEGLEWSGVRRDAVLLHELAHVRRFDLLTSRLTQLASTLYWFHPFVWLASRSQRAEAERACDDQVLHAGAQPSAYASNLLEIAGAIVGRERLDAAALAMARRSQLEGRLLAILDPTQPRRSVGRVAASLALLVAAASLGLLAGVRPAQSRLPEEPGTSTPVTVTQASEPDPGPSHAEASASIMVAPEPGAEPPARPATAAASATPSTPATPQEPSVTTASAGEADDAVAAAPPTPGAPAPPTLAAASTASKSGSSTHWSSSDNGNGTVVSGSWRHLSGSGSYKSKGTIRYNANLDDIESISNGGTVEIEDRRGGHQHRAFFRGSSGGIDRTYSVDGKDHPWDAEARAWFADLLMDLDHGSGMFADQRFPQLMSEGGPTRVLSEISQMDSDYGKSIYYRKLLGAAPDALTLRRVVTQAGHDVSSDYELARILVEAANRNALEDATTRAAYLEAVNGLDSDYEHARVLMVLVERKDLSSGLVDGAISSATHMDSDYEQARVMVALAEHDHVDPQQQRGYIRASHGLDSDYERGRVLRALLEHERLAGENINEMLTACGRFSSDYERANVMVALAGSVPMSEAARAAFVESTKAFSSDYDRDRALAALGRASQAR